LSAIIRQQWGPDSSDTQGLKNPFHTIFTHGGIKWRRQRAIESSENVRFN
jgi:hypothetical protein